MLVAPGGIDGEIAFDYTPEAVPAGHKAFQLSLKGLKGGHSGMDINLGRGNANKLYFRFLKAVSKELDLRPFFRIRRKHEKRDPA